MNKRPGGKLPSPLRKMMSIHGKKVMSIDPPDGIFITMIYTDSYGEWTDLEPEHFILPCLETTLFDSVFYAVLGKGCAGFSVQDNLNVASFAAVLANELGKEEEVTAWTELARRAEKYEGRIAFGTKHVTISYTIRD